MQIFYYGDIVTCAEGNTGGVLEQNADNTGDVMENHELHNENQTFTHIMTASNVDNTSHGVVCVIHVCFDIIIIGHIFRYRLLTIFLYCMYIVVYPA